MNVHDLTREHLVQLKERYLINLANEGTFAQVMNVDYDSPSYHDMMNADELVPDDVIFNEYESTEFTEDDFWK